MQKLFKTLALAVTLAAVLAGCEQPREQMVSSVGSAMMEAFPKDFSKLEFDERPAYDSEPAPTLVYKGADSTILVVSKPVYREHWREWMSMSGLAVTKNGRWFEFVYESDLTQDSGFLTSRPCTEDGCRHFSSTHPISLETAKRWYFDSDQFTPERYHALFNEVAPAKRVPA
jgi:hypothetical protein